MQQRPSRPKRARASRGGLVCCGFTLVEVVLALGIVAMAATLMITLFITLGGNVSSLREREAGLREQDVLMDSLRPDQLGPLGETGTLPEAPGDAGPTPGLNSDSPTSGGNGGEP